MSLGQALTHEAYQRTLSALHTIHFPLVITEFELRQIPVQMSLAAMLIHAFHAAFEDREETFSRVAVSSRCAALFLLLMWRREPRALSSMRSGGSPRPKLRPIGNGE